MSYYWIAICFVALYLLVVFVRASPEGAVMIGTVIGMIVLAVYYPTAFGIGLMGLIALAIVFVLLFDWGPKGWRLFVLWFDWLWRDPMDNSTGPPSESDQQRKQP